LRILEIVKSLKNKKKIKFYQASTSELYGKIQEKKQSEKTKFYPLSPYATSKLFAYWITKNYREAYNIFACNGILFNHESPRRGENFVTMKIVNGVKAILSGNEPNYVLTLGNIDSKRDWGHSKDYVYGMWLMMQQEKPDDYVLATGETKSIRDFVNTVAKLLKWPIRCEGTGTDEKVFLVRENKEDLLIIKTSLDFYRPSDVEYLCGSAHKAKEYLGWSPKYSFEELVSSMLFINK
jgi:GDPmannose 4,6-dehydratase